MTLTRQTPMRRTGFAKPDIGKPMAPKQVRCKECRNKFEPERPSQVVHIECAEAWAVKVREKEAAKRAAKDRKETREKLNAMLNIAQLIAKAQTAFNAFIRARDHDKGCFVCRRPFAIQPGRIQHAGHVRSRGAAGHLRFHEQNCHGECEGCNGPHGAKPHEIKAGAIARIGLTAFEALEADNEPHKWNRDELIGIEKKYKEKLKELRKTR